MPIQSISVFVGVIIPQSDCLQIMDKEPNDEVGMSFNVKVFVREFNDLIAHTLDKHHQAKVHLRAAYLTHDVDPGQPLVIGLKLGVIMDARDQVTRSMTHLTCEMLTRAKSEFHADVKKLADIDHDVYHLLKDRHTQIIYVQDGCKCCA